MRALDVGQGLGVLAAPLGQRVAVGVERLRVGRVLVEDGAQVGQRGVHVVAALEQHRPRIQQHRVALENRQAAIERQAGLGGASIALKDVRLDQVAVAHALAVGTGVGLQVLEPLDGARGIAAAIVQPRQPQQGQVAAGAAGHALVPALGLAEEVQRLGDMTQQQPARGWRHRAARLELGVKPLQRGAVLGQHQPGGALPQRRFVLDALAQHVGGAAQVALPGELAGGHAPQLGQDGAGIAQRDQALARRGGIAGFPKPRDLEQAGPRIIREAGHALLDDALRQRPVLEPPGHAGPTQPGCQPIGQHLLLEQLPGDGTGDHAGIAAGFRQHAQERVEARAIQRQQCPRGVHGILLVALRQRQADRRPVHADGAGVQGAPAIQGPPGEPGLLADQRDLGRALGHGRVRGRPGRRQEMPGRRRQVALLQRELAGHHLADRWRRGDRDRCREQQGQQRRKETMAPVHGVCAAWG